jgi:hypothetical protein
MTHIASNKLCRFPEDPCECNPPHPVFCDCNECERKYYQWGDRHGQATPGPDDMSQAELERESTKKEPPAMSRIEFETKLKEAMDKRPKVDNPYTRNVRVLGTLKSHPIEGYTLFEDGTYRVQIRDGLLSFLDLWYQMSARDSKEALCALVGGYDKNCTTAFIHEAICFEFGEAAAVERNAINLTAVLKGLWDASDGEMFFLGEWHSHPGQSNVYSPLDIDTAVKTCHESKLGQIFMLISGANGLAVRLVVPDGKIHFLEEVY